MEENKEIQQETNTENSPYEKHHIYSNVKIPVKVLDFLIIGLIIFMAFIIFTAQ